MKSFALLFLKSYSLYSINRVPRQFIHSLYNNTIYTTNTRICNIDYKKYNDPKLYTDLFVKKPPQFKEINIYLKKYMLNKDIDNKF